MNTRDFMQNTPIHFACLTGKLDMVKALLKYDVIGNGSAAGTAAQTRG